MRQPLDGMTGGGKQAGDHKLTTCPSKSSRLDMGYSMIRCSKTV